jgi:hypothetical protein
MSPHIVIGACTNTTLSSFDKTSFAFDTIAFISGSVIVISL